MTELQNLELVVSKPKNNRLQKIVLAVGTSVLAAPVFAADIVPPTISVEGLTGYIGLLVAAVATVATANLMIPMVAKGIKSIRTAF